MLRRLVKQAARSAGISLGSLEGTPWGADPFTDLRALEPRIAVALDVGANEGQTYRRLRDAFPSADIHSFEPVPQTFERLRATVGRDPRARCNQLALGAACGEAEITVSAKSGQNTLNTSAKPDAPTTRIQVSTVDAYLQEQGLSGTDLLKIDTEGFEIAVLEGARNALKAGAIRFVLAECEFVANPAEPHGDFFKIADLLLPIGYRVVSFYSGGVNGNGWLWGDVLFMLPSEAAPVTCSPFTRMREQRHRA
jgi:FkbM family methyltransferase